MDTPPQQREDKKVRNGAEKRQQDASYGETAVIAVQSGRGERLLPYLVAAMETCWVDAILIMLASFNAFEHATSLIPLWAPFLLIAGACWLMVFLEQREAVGELMVEAGRKKVSGSALFILLLCLPVLLVIWASIYAPAFLLFDARWLFALLNDLFALNGNAYYMFVLVMFAFYFCWRGVRLAHKVIEPGSVFWTLRLGMGIIIAAIIIHVSQGARSFNELILFGIVPLFLFLALVAHTLAKAAFMRSHRSGDLQGSIVGQERALLMTMSIIGLVILVLALGIGVFASPAFLVDVQRVLQPLGRFYDWLVTIIAYGITFLFYPIFWLITLFHVKIPSSAKVPIIRGVPPKYASRLSGSDPVITILVPVLKILLPVLFIVLMAWLIRRLLKRRRGQSLRQGQQETHESLWSGELFLKQLKAFLLAIWQRLFSRYSDQPETVLPEVIGAEVTARSVRAIYRALLRWAAGRGYGRKKEETPYEFKERLQQKMPQGEPELSNLTQAYSELRYGGIVLDEGELARVQMDWETLQRKLLSS